MSVWMCVSIPVCFTVSKPAIKCIFTPFANRQLCWRQYGFSWHRAVANVSSSILCSHCHHHHYHSHHHQPLQRNNTAFARTINNSPQTIPFYLHTASNCNYHYWSGICCNFFFFQSQTSELWKLLKGMPGMPTSRSSHPRERFPWPKFTVKTWAGLQRAGKKERGHEQEELEDVITASSLCPGSLLCWETTLWLENALLMTRIYPDEVPLRKNLNPHQLQAAGELFCHRKSVSLTSPWSRLKENVSIGQK